MATPTRIDWLASLLQATDPLFPTGAYAHSFGLEEIARLGLVRDEATLATFVHKQLIPLQENLELPYVRYAFAAALAGDVDLLCELNRELDALKLSREAREAGIQLGSRRLQTSLKMSAHPLLQTIAEQITAPHHLLVYSAQMAAAGAPLFATLTGYFYQALAGACCAALKLIRIGQDGIQRVLRSGLNEAGQIIRNSLEIPRDQAGWFNPLLEIASMRHERAQERLFIS